MTRLPPLPSSRRWLGWALFELNPCVFSCIFSSRLLSPASAMAQEPVFPAPERVKIDGVPPIPMAIADGVAPYGQFRQARFLAWHPTRQRILISTSFGNVSQIHEVRGPAPRARSSRSSAATASPAVHRRARRPVFHFPQGHLWWRRGDAALSLRSRLRPRHAAD